MNSQVMTQYWQAYLDTLPPGSPVRSERYMAEGFGDSPAMADELGDLVVRGIKTATCSALWEWQAEGDPLPEVGLKMIVLNGRGEPWCIIETIEVMIRPFNAESLFHDHVPANRHRLKSCWIYRRHAQEGFGATMPPGEMPRYDFCFRSLAEMVEAHQAEIRA